MDKRYIAGVFESCGQITFRKDTRTKNSVYPLLKISSKNIEILKKIKEIYGGSLKISKKSGNILLTHRKVFEFISDIYDYLLFKKELADIIIEFYEIRFTRKYEAKRKKDIVRRFIQIEGFEKKDLKKGTGSILNWLKEEE